MSAVLDTIRDLSRPAEAASELLQLSHRLGAHTTIPPAIQKPVREITDAVDANRMAWSRVDSYYVEILLRATLSAQIALMEPKLPESRDRLRFALDALAQAFASIAEGEPVSDGRTGKELVMWLAQHAGVSQAELARLVGVSPRQFQRWVSAAETSGPDGEDLRRVRAIVRIFNQLRFALTPSGAIAWFSCRLPDLKNKRPVDLLDKPNQYATLIGLASDMRSLTAT